MEGLEPAVVGVPAFLTRSRKELHLWDDDRVGTSSGESAFNSGLFSSTKSSSECRSC